MSVEILDKTTYRLRCDCQKVFPPLGLSSQASPPFIRRHDLWEAAEMEGWSGDGCPDCRADAKDKTFVIHEIDMDQLKRQQQDLYTLLYRDGEQMPYPERATLRAIKAVIDDWLQEQYRITPEQKEGINDVLGIARQQLSPDRR